MDYANFHYYHDGQDPNVPGPTKPSYNEVWQAIAAAATASGYGNKPIWCTEVGWTINTNCGRLPQNVVSEARQAQYEQEVLDDSRLSQGLVTAVMLYTMDNGCNGMSLTQGAYTPRGPSSGTRAPPIRTTQAYSMLKTYTAHYPSWSTSGGGQIMSRPTWFNRT